MKPTHRYFETSEGWLLGDRVLFLELASTSEQAKNCIGRRERTFHRIHRELGGVVYLSYNTVPIPRMTWWPHSLHQWNQSVKGRHLSSGEIGGRFYPVLHIWFQTFRLSRTNQVTIWNQIKQIKFVSFAQERALHSHSVFPKIENLGVQNFDTISFFPKRSIIWMHRVVGKCRPMAPLRFYFANLTSKIPLVSWLNPGCMTWLGALRCQLRRVANLLQESSSECEGGC